MNSRQVRTGGRWRWPIGRTFFVACGSWARSRKSASARRSVVQPLRWLLLIYLVDPIAGEIHQLLQVAADADDFLLETAYFTDGSDMFVPQRRSAIDHMTHGRIDR